LRCVRRGGQWNSDPRPIILQQRREPGEERDIADMHALPRAEYLKMAWADPVKGDVDFTALSVPRI
jgi:hypothetical protein